MHSRTFAERTAGMLERDFATARELDFEDWYQRSFVARLRERFWGRIEALGARIAQRQRINHVRRGRTGGRRGRIDTTDP